jgi:hypothetical protein
VRGVLLGGVVAGALHTVACGPCQPVAPPASRAASVPVVPDGLVEVGFNSVAGLVELVGHAARIGLLPEAARAVTVVGLEEAGIAAPLIVALRQPPGDVIVSARLRDRTRLVAALSVAVPSAGLRLERRFGVVDAVLDEAGAIRALLRIGDDAVLLAIEPTDAVATAALLDAVATGVLGERRVVDGPIRFTVGALPGIRRAHGTVTVAGSRVTLDGVVDVEDFLADVVRGLQSEAPPFACAVEEGAVIAARLPPVVGTVAAGGGVVDSLAVDAADAFTGRVVIALHPVPRGTPVAFDDRATLASLVVAAQPRVGGRAALEAALGSTATMASRTVAGRAVRTMAAPGRPWRDVTAVVDDGRFALGIGVDTPVDRVAATSSCPPSPTRLLVINGAQLRAAVGRLRPDLGLLGLFVHEGDAAAVGWPWTGLLAVDRWEVDATETGTHPEGVSAAVTVRIDLPPVR